MITIILITAIFIYCSCHLQRVCQRVKGTYKFDAFMLFIVNDYVVRSSLIQENYRLYIHSQQLSLHHSISCSKRRKINRIHLNIRPPIVCYRKVRPLLSPSPHLSRLSLCSHLKFVNTVRICF